MATILRQGDGRVSFAELFYDLVFVFAITQISHHLLAHYSLSGAVETGFLFLSIWWIWIYSTWVFNRLDPERVPVRLLLFAMMLGGLFLSMAVPEAFGARGAVFGLAYASIHLGRSLFVLAAARGNAALTRVYQRILFWNALAAVFWIAGGLAGPGARLGLWSLALAIDVTGPLVGYRTPGLGRSETTDYTVNGGHMAERCGLFVIICLGESLLVSGATFGKMDWTAAGLLAFGAAVAGAVGMWWVYFHIGHRSGSHRIEHSADPGRIARLSFTYLHVPIVGGIILGAVAAERAIAHPGDAATLAEGASALGGPALFLAGVALFRAAAEGAMPRAHLLGLALAGVLLVLGPLTTLLAVNLGAAAILILVAALDRARQDHAR